MATTAGSTKVRLRQLWFQVHKWIGLTLALPIVVICLTGSALVWHDWVDEALNMWRVTRPGLGIFSGFTSGRPVSRSMPRIALTCA